MMMIYLFIIREKSFSQLIIQSLVMNSKSSNNIYELSKNIEEEEQKKFAAEAKSIANAYRKVEQLKVDTAQRKQSPKKSKLQSTYTQKIKETLKQINANKTKQMQSLRRMAVQPPSTNIKKELCKLKKVGSTKLFNTLDYYHLKLFQYSYKKLKQYWQQQQAKQNQYIQNYRVYRYFKAWSRTTLVLTTQRKKEEQQLGLKSEQIAKQFHFFVLLRKSFKSWQVQVGKSKKRKTYEQQLIKKQIQQQQVTKQLPNTSKKIVENAQLQSKVRGFLQNLKQKIEKKDRLITIKQNTQQSDIHFIRKETEQVRQEQQSLEGASNDQLDESRSVPNSPQQIVIQPPQPQAQKKPMSNDDLQKKRRQLEVKHKSRKEALEKLRKQKEEKRKQQQKEREELQKQIEAEQKRIKQEKYRQYVKNKQQQQEWQRRQIELNEKAQHFNTYRILKYYGFKPMVSVRKVKNNKITTLYQTILLILYRIRSQNFMRNLEVCAQQQLQSKIQKMNKRYILNLLRKSYRAIQENRQKQLQLKSDYRIMHEVNTLKIYLSAWKRVNPLLCNENYEWERPRMKRAMQFYKLQLCLKSLRSLKKNKESEQKERCIAQQKTKIKNKIKSMLEDEESFDYNSYL